MTTITPTQSAQTGVAANSANTLAGNFSDFLTLLTTQLQHQDPTSPMDTTQFTSQLVQFASVEQQINSNANLETLIKLTRGEQVLQASSLVGAVVVADSDQVALQGGIGQIRFNSDVAGPTVISVFNSAGRVIRSDTLDATVGENAVVWDGQDADGRQMPDGAYTMTVAQPGADGRNTMLDFGTVATVTGARRNGETMQVQLGPLAVGLEAVTSIISR